RGPVFFNGSVGAVGGRALQGPAFSVFVAIRIPQTMQPLLQRAAPFELSGGGTQMNRRGILSISAMTGFGLALVPGSAVGQEKPLKDQLVGSWILVSTETMTQSGKRYPYGTDPRGILIFDAIGRYAAVQGRIDRPKLKSAVRRDVTKEEFGAAALDFAANFGSWAVNVDKALVRRFEGALNPNLEGIVTKASISLVGDTLRLSGELNPVTGERIDAVYRRAK